MSEEEYCERICQLEKELEEEKEKNRYLNWYYEKQAKSYIHKEHIKEKFKKVKEECEIELVYQIIDLLEKELLGE